MWHNHPKNAVSSHYITLQNLEYKIAKPTYTGRWISVWLGRWGESQAKTLCVPLSCDNTEFQDNKNSDLVLWL